MRSRVRHFGARKPKVIERRVVAVTFDNRGVVRNVAERTRWKTVRLYRCRVA